MGVFLVLPLLLLAAVSSSVLLVLLIQHLQLLSPSALTLTNPTHW
jgi:hypothetical protein